MFRGDAESGRPRGEGPAVLLDFCGVGIELIDGAAGRRCPRGQPAGCTQIVLALD
jgi:hypothetical protein